MVEKLPERGMIIRSLTCANGRGGMVVEGKVMTKMLEEVERRS
jgi:hypothetical protein